MSLLTRGPRVRCWLLVTALMACVSSSHLHAQEAEGARRVLVLNSTRLDDQFSVTWARELPKLLGEGLNQQVDFYAEYFDFVRFPGPQNERAYLDFLQLKYARKHVDLVIVIGAVVMDLMMRHRNVLFADTPVVSYTLFKTEGHLANSTGLFNPLNFGRSIDLMLALQPDLERIYVVSGAGTADQDFERQARAEFRPFESRVAFTYFSGLAMSDLERRLKALPPRSAVYYVVVRQDLAGEQFQVMASLTRVAAAANAPTYSWADAAAETGIVGGSRRDQLVQTKAIAALALRVLRGERADDIPVSNIDTNVNLVDWRQLRRWGLDESRLPSGTRVLFREPSAWDRYRRYIVGAVVLMLAQTALITGLLVHRRMRRRVELELRDSEAKLRVSYDRNRHLSRRLLGEQEAERARLARELHDDISQRLAILSIQLDLLVPDRRQVDSASRLSRALETVHDITASVRALSHRLHPAKLQLIGLVAGIDDLRRDLSPPHLSIAFSHRDVPAQIDQAIQLCVFRVAQEALWNAVRHSNAGRIEVELTGGPSTVALTVTDDGRGFEPDHVVNAGLGLTSMRERVESVGGTFELHTTQGSGTRVMVTVPIQTPAEESVS